MEDEVWKRCRRKWEENKGICVREIACISVDWTQLAQDRYFSEHSNEASSTIEAGNLLTS
jgi:hypothetical protein